MKIHLEIDTGNDREGNRLGHQDQRHDRPRQKIAGDI